MSFPDLWIVTDAIRSLIKTKASAAYGMPGVDVTVLSPQDDSGTLMQPVVNLYLYHLIENAHYKNQPPRNGSGPIPIQHIPIGLDVHYVITVRVPESETRVQSEHKLLGIVAKILHDNPIVTRDVLGNTILEEDDRFDLILRPVSLEEATTFWASDDIHVTRPSFFVEARVIQLNPEPPQILPGIVLTLGTFVFAGRGPRLLTSRSQLAFVPPGFGVQRVSAEPARVALFVRNEDPWVDDPPDDAEPLIRQNNRLTLVGSGFGRGHRFLELARIGDTEPDAIRTLDLEAFPVPAENVAWGFEIRPDSIGLSFHTEVRDAAGNLKSFIPGLYTARVVLDEEPRPSVSNQIVFAVVPQVIDVNSASATVHSVVVAGAYLALPEAETSLVIGDQIFTKVSTLTAAGQYRVLVGGTTIEFQIAPPVAADFPIPINLTVNGAQATPAWVEAP